MGKHYTWRFDKCLSLSQLYECKAKMLHHVRHCPHVKDGLEMVLKTKDVDVYQPLINLLVSSTLSSPRLRRVFMKIFAPEISLGRQIETEDSWLRWHNTLLILPTSLTQFMLSYVFGCEMSSPLMVTQHYLKCNCRWILTNPCCITIN